MTATLVIPKLVKDGLLRLTNNPFMLQGALITEKQEGGLEETILSGYVTAVGSEGVTYKSSGGRAEVLSSAISQVSPKQVGGQIGLIQFHTHSIETVRSYGEGYLGLPPLVCEQFRNETQKDPGYRHVLVTPTRIHYLGMLVNLGEAESGDGMLGFFRVPNTSKGKIKVAEVDVLERHQLIQRVIRAAEQKVAPGLPPIYEFKL